MSQDRDLFGDFKDRYSVIDVWLMLCPQFGEPKLGMNKSPFREERSASFSIYEGGKKFKDHGHAEHAGDVIEFLKIALDTDHAGVREWIMERMGIDHEDGIEIQRRAYKKPPVARKPIQWPGKLIEGTPATWAAFAEKRGLTAEGVEAAVGMGILRFAVVDGRQCYVVMDSTGRAAEIRDIKGRLWGDPAKGSKAYPLANVQKDWLPGAVHLVGKSKEVGLIITEGATDLLTAIDMYLRYTGEVRWVSAALLGANCRTLSEDCGKLVAGRFVRIVPDADDAGDKMAETWRDLLVGYQCTVDVVRLPRGKDLTDMKSIIKPEALFNVRN